MEYYTKIGVPVNLSFKIDVVEFPIFNDLRGFVYKGDLIGQLTIDRSNYFQTKKEAFEILGLWENENGVYVEGVHRENIRIQNPDGSLIVKNPVFVGDIVNQKIVVEAYGLYDLELGIWRIKYKTGDLPIELEEEGVSE